MMGRMEDFGLEELTADTQRAIVGGDGFFHDLGKAVGYAVGAVVEVVVAAAADFEYDNPRYSGTWQG